MAGGGLGAAQPVDAVLFDVDFTLAKPGPLLGPEGYREAGQRHGLTLDPERYAAARAAAVEDLRHHPESSTTRRSGCASRRTSCAAWAERARALREVARAITDGWLHSANFELYEDVLPVLASIREQGVAIGLVSNTSRDLTSSFATSRWASTRGSPRVSTAR